LKIFERKVRKMKNKYKFFGGKPEGKGSPRETSRRWKDNIKMDLREI
jgi:hypothetical protein